MPDYIEFALKYKDICKCQFIYIKEAHFLETDEQGKFIDGWPRGYFGFEYPQHKSQEQRLQMAQILKTKYNIPDEFPIYQDIYPQNLFDESFGIWPDNLCVFKDGKLIYRGIINLDGTRKESHSKELEEWLDNFKY
ncbi:unnamed protein product [Paramecium primaurelia]|uniref:Iodothyronine deiodinase n=1 Tax=Paramecium primaurelia TaxID=5886 RepID=A0A8S1NDM9_PARPR|nr:unnamed protein product [Paramecium primaurelia]CAD8087215.1 unnamed protein product [Paramecium primaurelia]